MRILLRVGSLLVLLTAIVAGITFLSAARSEVAVFSAPGHAAETAVEAGGAVVESSSMMAIASSSEPGFISRLYGAGAFLVIDARVVTALRAVLTRSGPAEATVPG